MTTIRIGNDINVTWKIFSRNGMKFSLDGVNLHLWLLSGPFKKEYTDFTVALRNEISFVIDAKDITRYGVYKLLLIITDKETETEDASFEVSEVFQIVSKYYSSSNNPVLDGDVTLTPSSVLNNIVTSTLEGKSAYEIAVEHGYTKSEAEWLASLVGEDGQKGDTGKSAYQVWIEAGHSGSVDEYLASLKGDTGVGFQSVSSAEDGTIVITLSSGDTINIDLNHDHTAYEEKSNKVTSLSSSSTDDEYPSAKCVYNIVGDIETLLAAL